MLNQFQVRLQNLKGWQWFLILYLIALPVLFKPTLHGSDPLGYYAWLRSAVLDFNLNVDNEFTELNFDAYFRVFTPTGYRVNHWSIGPAVLWLPFFIVAHLLTMILAWLGGPWPADGYSLPYVLSASLGSTIYVLIGLYLLHKIAMDFVAESIATLATITVWFASPLLFYMFSTPLMSHAVDFFVNALFIWVWYRTRSHLSWRGWLLRGACIGLAMLVRPQNFLLAAFPALELIIYLGQSQNPWRTRITTDLRFGLSFILGIFIFLGPQMIFWRVVFGQWIVSAYTWIPEVSDTTTLFNFFTPRLLQLAFSSDRGLFFWSPILLLATLGLIILFWRDKYLATLLAIIFGLQFYLISSSIWWNGGGTSFGSRVLVGVLPVFVIGLAIIFDLLQQRFLAPQILVIIAIFFIVWNILLIVQYALGTIPRVGTFSPSEMIRNQFLVIPENLSRIVRALLTRQAD